MSAEHQSVLAQMARLQGTIDECKKNLSSTSSSNNHTNTNSTPPTTNTKPLPPANYYSRLNSALPLVTKTTWKLAPAPTRGQSHPNLIRPQAHRSTKLILNRPSPSTIQTKPTNPPSSSTPINPSSTTLSVSAPPFKPSSIHPPSDQLLTPSLAPPSISLPPTNMTPSPVAQTTSNLGNMSLAPDPVSANRSPAPATVKSNELLINGVSFVRDPQGKKLVRKTDPAPAPPTQSNQVPQPPASSSTSQTHNKATPIKALIGGMTYVRTKSGNLVELTALKKFHSQRLQEIKRAKLLAAVNAMKGKYTANRTRSYSSNTWDPKKTLAQSRHSKLANKISRPPLIKKDEQCRFFAKTGACRNGLTCVYQHDPSQVAICPRYLRNKCSYSANSCPLSHKPNPHNMEHCSHFPRCNKAECPYPHIKPTTSMICQEFADLGWCSKGAQCTERHVRECPEFSTKGTCSNPGCRLRHMINRNNKNDDEEANPKEDPRTTDEAGSSDDETKISGSAGLFFTDLTGSDHHKGKRKASQHPSSAKTQADGQQRTFKGISHNTEVSPVVKRIKYDQMAENSDFVMFISSDEEGGPGPNQKESDALDSSSEDEEEQEQGESAVDPSSVDSEELDSVLMDQDHLHHHQEEEEEEEEEEERGHAHKSEQVQQQQEQDRPLPTPTHPLPPRPPPPFFPRSAALIFPTPTPNFISPLPQKPVKLRNRSSLEPGEEIEEGEIFDDDDLSLPSLSNPLLPNSSSHHQFLNDHHHRIHLPSTNSINLVNPDLSDFSDEDDDEIVARLLLGNHPL